MGPNPSLAEGVQILTFDFVFAARHPRCANDDTDNVFTGTEEIEFSEAEDTIWSGNSLPSGVCLKNRDGTSTFTGSSDGLPGIC